MNTSELDVLMHTRQQIAQAGRGAKAELVSRAAELLGCSVPTVYRKLGAAGLAAGRSRRQDAGSSGMQLEELRLVSGLLFTSRRQNDKQLLTIEDASEILLASGAISTRLSPQRISVLLRQHHLHPDQLAQPKPATEMRSLHPNHVWGIDSSTCVLYYVRAGHLAAMDAETYYKNKPANVARVLNDLCTRYVVADHYSGALKLRYYLGGETAENLVDFWLHCVTQQPGVPMHGVPLLLVLDRGPGNTSHLFGNLARRMQCELIFTGVGNPRAKGFVEKPQDIVERHFEGRFRFLQADDLTLDRINDMAAEWAAAHCSTRKHSRTGEPRYSTWMRITPEQLRVPASLELLRDLATHEPESRGVSNLMSISFVVKGWGKLHYDVSTVPGAVVGGKVWVAVNVYRAPAVDVRTVDADTGEEVWQTVAPIERNEAGFRADAPVIGQEYRTAAYTPVDRERNRITQDAYRLPGAGLPTLEEAAKARKAHAQAYAEQVDAMADVRATVVPSYLPRRGTELATPAVRTLVPTLLPVVEACKRLKVLMGEAYTPQVYSFLADKFAAGVPEQLLAEIAAQFTGGAAEQPATLRVVGGAA